MTSTQERAYREMHSVRRKFYLPRFFGAIFLAAAVTVATAGIAAPASAYALACNTDFAKKVSSRNGGYMLAPVRSTSSGGNMNLTCYMWNGDVSTAPGYSSLGTKRLQRSLNRCYGQSLTVDGRFGPATETALKRAQRAESIGIDGKYGPQTAKNIRFAKTSSGCGRIKLSNF